MKNYEVKKIKNNQITIQEDKNKKSIGAIIYTVTMSLSIIIFLLVLGIMMSKMLFSKEPGVSSEKLDIEINIDDTGETSTSKDVITNNNLDNNSSDTNITKNNNTSSSTDASKYNYIKTYINDSNRDEDLSFTVNNNTNKKYKYRIVIEKSEQSTLKTDYIKYSIKVNNKKYKNKTNINEQEWTNNSQLDKTTYILYESVLDSNSHIDVALNIYIDYSLVNNDSQNKYWYGTIKVYAWDD